jgi:nucleotide-binding universal stress UspA family protein
MEIIPDPCWSKPSRILLATEIPVNNKVFSYALAKAIKFNAELVIFHAIEKIATAPLDFSKNPHGDDISAYQVPQRLIEPFAERAKKAGIHCKTMIQTGAPANQILDLLSKQQIDSVIMGTHTHGPIGKLLVGSVADAVLCSANVPVDIVGPDVQEGTHRNFSVRNVLCPVCTQAFGHLVVSFAAEIATGHNANLFLQYVIPPQERDKILAVRSIDQIKARMLALVPVELQGKIRILTNVVIGDPVEELLYQSKIQHTNIIVMGAPCASHFAAVSCSGIVYQIVAHAHCPVVTLSPVVLAKCGARLNLPRPSDVNYMAGVF